MKTVQTHVLKLPCPSRWNTVNLNQATILKFVKVALVQIQCYINIAMFYNLMYYLELKLSESKDLNL